MIDDSVRPFSLALRFIIASSLALWVGFIGEKTVIGWSIAPIHSALSFLQDDFAIIDISIARQGPNETLRVRADLNRPLYIGQRFVYPINLASRDKSQPIGWLQVNLTLGGLLQYGLLMSVVVLAWPARRWTEYVVRCAAAIPCFAALLLISAVSTLYAELNNSVYEAYAPNEFLLSFAWSKFLMGGGGAMLALVSAVGCIAISTKAVVDKSIAPKAFLNGSN